MCERFTPNAGTITKTWSDDGFSMYITRTWPCGCTESYQVYLGEEPADDTLTNFFACDDYYASISA